MGGGKAASLVLGPKEGYASIVDKGEQLCKASLVQIFALSVMAGGYIGFGALLSMTICGSIDGAVKGLGDGVKKWLFAALFPVNLLFILLSGCILYTGATFTCPAAWIEGRAKMIKVVGVISVAWIGNLIGGIGFAIFTELCGLNVNGVARISLDLLSSKTTKGFGVIFLRGIGCNWLVCMAVFLQTLSSDLTGKYVGIFFPISTFVACGFEHYPANAYALPLAFINSQKEEWKEYWEAGGASNAADIFGLNLVPCTLGNLVAGVVIMSCGFSYFYGSLRTCPPPMVMAAMGKETEPQDEKRPKLAAVEEYEKMLDLEKKLEQHQKDIEKMKSQQQTTPMPEAPQQPWNMAIMQNNGGFARTVSC